ncbi:MAG: S1 RNA-binding domain-containing protein [Alphaproteobacteria bacterium]|nr:MAG: S1 RNA-binding domain-containing protein [Alphaproteobacteria bacterium]
MNLSNVTPKGRSFQDKSGSEFVHNKSKKYDEGSAVRDRLGPKARKYDKQVEVDSGDESLLSKFVSDMVTPREKTIVKATVSNITKDYVWVNIGIKAEGKIAINEFFINGFGEVPKLGALIEVWLDRHEDSNGNLVVSFSKVTHIRAYKELEEIFNTKKLVEGTIVDKVRGGYIVALLPWGVKAFLPSSQIDIRTLIGKSLSTNVMHVMKNKKIPFFIIRMERKWNIIVSRKNLDQKEDGSDASVES